MMGRKPRPLRRMILGGLVLALLAGVLWYSRPVDIYTLEPDLTPLWA